MDAPLLPGLAGALEVELLNDRGLVLGLVPGGLLGGDGHLVHHPPLLLLQEGGPPILLDDDDHLSVLHHGLVHPDKEQRGEGVRRQGEQGEGVRREAESSKERREGSGE